MRLHGVVRTAELQDDPLGGDRVELILRVQGVGPGQPRSIIVPFERLIADESLGAEEVTGRGFEAEVEQTGPARWVVSRIAFASRVLRGGEGPAG